MNQVDLPQVEEEEVVEALEASVNPVCWPQQVTLARGWLPGSVPVCLVFGQTSSLSGC